MQGFADESRASAAETFMPTRKHLHIGRDLEYTATWLTKFSNNASKHHQRPKLARKVQLHFLPHRQLDEGWAMVRVDMIAATIPDEYDFGDCRSDFRKS